MREQGTCSYSKCEKTFTKRNYRQHACCDSHRTLSNREKKGTKSPYSSGAVGNVKGNMGATAFSAALPQILNGASGFSMATAVGTAVISNVAAPNVVDAIKKGKVDPLRAGAGAAGGYFISGWFTKNPLLRVLAGLAGGYIANEYYSVVVTPATSDSPVADMTRENNKSAITPESYADIINSRDYRQLSLPSIQLNNKYQSLFGKPASNFYMMVHGLPGQGKTHWAVSFADYFNKNHGSVLYYAAEQNGLSKSFQDIQNKLKTSFQIHTHPEKLSIQEIQNHFNQFSLVVIDSVNALKLSHEQLKTIRDNSNAATLVILQSNKDGDYKGTQNWKHDVDISVKIEDRKPTIEKSRFGGSEGKTFESGRVVNL